MLRKRVDAHQRRVLARTCPVEAQLVPVELTPLLTRRSAHAGTPPAITSPVAIEITTVSPAYVA
jgi:hypothetical protein